MKEILYMVFAWSILLSLFAFATVSALSAINTTVMAQSQEGTSRSVTTGPPQKVQVDMTSPPTELSPSQLATLEAALANNKLPGPTLATGIVGQTGVPTAQEISPPSPANSSSVPKTTSTPAPLLPVKITVIAGSGTEMSPDELATREAMLAGTKLGNTPVPINTVTPQLWISGLVLVVLFTLLVGFIAYMFLKRRNTNRS